MMWSTLMMWGKLELHNRDDVKHIDDVRQAGALQARWGYEAGCWSEASWGSNEMRMWTGWWNQASWGFTRDMMWGRLMKWGKLSLIFTGEKGERRSCRVAINLNNIFTEHLKPTLSWHIFYHHTSYINFHFKMLFHNNTWKRPPIF